MVNLRRRHDTIKRFAAKSENCGIWYALGAATVHATQNNRRSFNIHALNVIKWLKEERSD